MGGLRKWLGKVVKYCFVCIATLPILTAIVILTAETHYIFLILLIAGGMYWFSIDNKSKKPTEGAK